MNTAKFFLSFIILFSNSFLIFGRTTVKPGRVDTLRSLEISGRIQGVSTQKYYGLTIRLYHDNKLEDSIVVDQGNVFSFTLKRNTFYTLKISCLGYISRTVSIDTEMPVSVKDHEVFRFHFDTTLMKDDNVSNIDLDCLDFPIALIKYQHDKNYFDYSKKYTRMIKNKLSNDSIN